MIFDSKLGVENMFSTDFTQAQISEEPMFFNADLDFALHNGGPITQEFIRAIPSSWLNDKLVLDSRVHMLMPGWYPCIPGWHHDDVERSRADKQPNYINPSYRSEHLLGLVNAEICPTEFAIGRIELEIPEAPKIIYKEWHPQVENAVFHGNLRSHFLRSGYVYRFNDHSFHQGVKAVSNGWRWFCRVSRNTARTDNITNQIRKQVQVYLEFPMEGW